MFSRGGSLLPSSYADGQWQLCPPPAPTEHLRMKLPRDVYADLTRIVYDFIKEFEEICK